jgi:hypothetical protein
MGMEIFLGTPDGTSTSDWLSGSFFGLFGDNINVDTRSVTYVKCKLIFCLFGDSVNLDARSVYGLR